MLLSAVQWCRAGEGEKHFLWKVRSKTGTAYLFGSVHLAQPDIYPLPKTIEESFDKAAVLAVEADPGQAGDASLQQQMLSAAMYPGSDTLRQHLSPKTYELTAREMEKLGLPLEQFSKFKPWFLAMTIEILEFSRLGYNQENGLDVYFAGKAKGKKRIVELESFDYQIKLLGGFSDREQELFLLYTLKDVDELDKGIGELMGAWRTGDAKAMERLVMKSLREVPEIRPIYDKLFFVRNREMAAKVEQLLRSQETAFVVVGAAHLVGAEGVVELLRQKGYPVEQL
jgi:uncharacterized protein YbaP (TraB family)